MDTKTFLENFGTIAEAPGGIERLRSTIYEMAVHGHLSGGSVSIMETTNPVCLPGWSIKPLREIATYGGFGQELGSNLPESAWMLDLEDVEKSTSRLLAKVRVSERRSSSSKNLFQKNDVLYGKLRPYLDKVLIADEDGYCTSEIIPIRPGDGVCAEWLRICLKAPTFIDYVSSKSYGMKMPRLGTKDALASLHAVPPLAEQKRIVAKVDELMALCDELQEKQQRKATVTTKLRGSAFNALRQAETPDDLAAAWERISTNWTHLTNHPDSIPELRKTILDLAYSEKLMLNYPDGTSGEWDATTLGEVAEIRTGKLDANASSPNGQYPFFTCARLPLRIDSYTYDFECALIGGNGNFDVHYANGKFDAYQRTYIIKPKAAEETSAKFLYWFMQGYSEELRKQSIGGVIQYLKIGFLKDAPLRLPSLRVQELVVAKIEFMLAMCDQLEKQIQYQQDLGSRLAIASTRLAG